MNLILRNNSATQITLSRFSHVSWYELILQQMRIWETCQNSWRWCSTWGWTCRCVEFQVGWVTEVSGLWCWRGQLLIECGWHATMRRFRKKAQGGSSEYWSPGEYRFCCTDFLRWHFFLIRQRPLRLLNLTSSKAVYYAKCRWYQMMWSIF